MGRTLLDKILGRNKDDEFGSRILMVDPDDEEASARLKGFNPAPIVGISQKLRRRFRSFDDLIDYLEEQDQTWVVTKNGQILENYETFPEYQTIIDDFYKKHGGGTYAVKALSPKVLRVGSYKLEGEDKTETVDQKEETRRKKEAAKNLTPEDEMFYDAIKNNAEFKERYVDTLMKKRLNIKDDKEKEKEQEKTLEQLIADRVNKSPKLLDKLVEAEIEDRLGKEKPKKELSREEQLTKLADEWRTMKELFGEKQEGTDWGSVFKEFVKQGGIGELMSTMTAVMKPDAVEEVQRQEILRQQMLLQKQKERALLVEAEPEQLEPEIVTEETTSPDVKRSISDRGGVIFAGKPVVSAPPSPAQESQTKISPEVIQVLPYIPELIKSMSPEEAFNLLNTMSPESCDTLYSINLGILNVAIKHANTNILESKGKLDSLLSEDGQKWLARFLEVNKAAIDKETALQAAEPAPAVPGDE